MKKTLILLTLILNFFSVNSQWTLQTDEFHKPVVKIYFHDLNTGWLGVAGFYTFQSTGKFAVTTNGGTNWHSILGGCTIYNDFKFINSSTGWLIGTCSFDTEPYRLGYLLKTTNSGFNFIYQRVDTGKGFTAIDFLNENTGWLCVSQNLIYQTTDSGNNWINIYDTSQSPPYKKIEFETVNNGYLLNAYSIFKTSNGGSNWRTVHSITGPVVLNDFYFVNDITGYLVGSMGKVFKSTNAGENWFQQSTSTGLSLKTVYFVSDLTGYIAGNDEYSTFSRVLLKTTNGGANWISQFAGTNHGLYGVHFINENTGWIAGGESMNTYGVGVVYKTTNAGIPIGIEIISTEIPDQFSLSQNYPNPFNPETRIKFTIPAVGNGRDRSVRILIYDMLGREIAVLVNEQLNPGTYEVNWDASAYPSGVYLYKLQAGDYSETKKMMLIK